VSLYLPISHREGRKKQRIRWLGRRVRDAKANRRSPSRVVTATGLGDLHIGVSRLQDEDTTRYLSGSSSAFWTGRFPSFFPFRPFRLLFLRRRPRRCQVVRHASSSSSTATTIELLQMQPMPERSPAGKSTRCDAAQVYFSNRNSVHRQTAYGPVSGAIGVFITTTNAPPAYGFPDDEETKHPRRPAARPSTSIPTRIRGRKWFRRRIRKPRSSNPRALTPFSMAAMTRGIRMRRIRRGKTRPKYESLSSRRSIP
jgi:hypothetical protein